MPAPLVFTNAAKANAIAGSPFPSAASWFLRETWGPSEPNSSGGSAGGIPVSPGERWKTAYDGGKIDLVLLPASQLWQATFFYG